MVQTCNQSLDAAWGRLGDPRATRLFKALSDPTRIALLAGLARRGPATVSEVAGCCPVDLSVVSRHLALLREAGIVACEKKGKEVRCRIRYATLAGALRELADAIEACCPTDDPPLPQKENQP
jgi:ArsR family transcriptional regulator